MTLRLDSDYGFCGAASFCLGLLTFKLVDVLMPKYKACAMALFACGFVLV